MVIMIKKSLILVFVVCCLAAIWTVGPATAGQWEVTLHNFTGEAVQLTAVEPSGRTGTTPGVGLFAAPYGRETFRGSDDCTDDVCEAAVELLLDTGSGGNLVLSVVRSEGSYRFELVADPALSDFLTWRVNRTPTSATITLREIDRP